VKSLAAPFLETVWQTPTLRRGVIACVALALLASAAEIAVALSLLPILVSLGVDAGTELDGFVSRIPPIGWLILFTIAAGLRSLSGWLSAVRQQRATQDLVLSLQTRLYRALATAHWDAVRHLSPPTITSALQSQTYEAGYGFSYLVQIITASLLVVGYLVSSAVVFPLVLFALLGILVVMWWLNVRRSKRVNTLSEDYVSAHTELHQRYEDWVAISRISSLGVDTDKLAGRFEAGAREAATHTINYSRTSAATAISYDAARVASIAIGVPIAWWLNAPPALLAFGLVALIRVLPQASGIQTGYQGIVNAVAPLQAVRKLTAKLELDQIQPPASSAALQWKTIELKGVGVEDTIREDGRRWILRDVNLELKFGEWLGLIGPTGAGKTTLAELMLMLVRPDSGEISIDAKLADDEIANRWRYQAAYVPQDIVLLDGSRRDNLRLYVPDATDNELLHALGLAAADFVTHQLPEGLDTRVGPGGRWLSGGERQRIGIARALLRKPGFLVLDEPTAALDADTQQALMSALAGLKRDMSVVLITHRKELLALADRVISAENGAIRYSDADQHHL
jgi:ATP-binding cassette subfamily C protein